MAGSRLTLPLCSCGEKETPLSLNLFRGTAPRESYMVVAEARAVSVPRTPTLNLRVLRQQSYWVITTTKPSKPPPEHGTSPKHSTVLFVVIASKVTSLSSDVRLSMIVAPG